MANVDFELKGVNFTESKFFTPAELTALAAPLIGNRVRFSDLQQLVERINGIYAARQVFTATAVLPTQTVSEGRVQIKLVEGKLGQVNVKGNEYVSTEFLRSRIDLMEGDIIDLNQVETSLARFNRGSSVRLSATLEPGTAFGLTDIQVSALEPQRNALDFFINNTGFKSTGAINSGIFFRHTGMLGRDDRLSLSYSGSQGLGVTNFSYDAPVGRDGARVGLSLFASRVRVISGPFANIQSSGDSEGWSVNASYPLSGDIKSEWIASANLGRVKVNNYVADVLLNESGVITTGAGLTYSLVDDNESLVGAFNLLCGMDETHIGGARKYFSLLNGNFKYTKLLTTKLSTSVFGAWQFASNKELPSGNMFQLGGSSTVRGYSQGAIAGDGGAYLTVQLNHAFHAGVNGFLFLDTGFINSAIVQPAHVTGYGIGSQWSLGKAVSGVVTLARPTNQVDSNRHSTTLYMQLVSSF